MTTSKLIFCFYVSLTRDSFFTKSTLEELQLIDNHPQYFDFKSAIVQQVVYNSLLKAQKISLHKKVAFWFEDRFKIQEAGHYYPILGYHYHQAGLVKEAVHYYMKVVQSFLCFFFDKFFFKTRLVNIHVKLILQRKL